VSNSNNFYLDIGDALYNDGTITSFKVEYYDISYITGSPTQISPESQDTPKLTPGYVETQFSYDDNIPPTCNLSANPNSGDASLITDFSMSASDSDGAISSWELDVDNDGTAEYSGIGTPPSTQSHTYDNVGTYTAELTVWDDAADTGIDTEIITVTEPNYAPAAPINLFVQYYGSVILQDTSSSFSKAYSGTIKNDHTATHISDNTYHEISENNRIQGSSGKAGLDVTYDISISSGTAAPYTLYIEAKYSDSGESYTLSYTVNGAGGESSIITLSTSETSTLYYKINGVSAGDTVNVNIKDSSQTPQENVGKVYIDHLYIESGGSGGGTNDNILTWNASIDDGTGADDVTHYNVYKSDSTSWSSTGSITADNSLTYSYIDSSAGTADTTQWWYKVTAVDSGGLESEDSNSAQEPGTTNSPPTAVFIYTTSELTATFIDQSTDSDGTIAIWSWDFGDGNSSTAQNPTHIYATAGTYTVTLTVIDDDGAIGTTTQSVTVTSSSGITLSATGYKVKGRHHADLEWSGATSSNVDIYRDGEKIITTENDGLYTDNTGNVGSGSYTYRIFYDDGTETWSNEATVTF
jgi:PKD repeat protein